MSILIKKLFGKDMPMPQEGYIDVRLHFKGGKIECATMQTGESPLYATFDVEEVPTPHGRLIDGNQLETIMVNAIAMCTTVAEALECKDDPEIKMEIKAYTDILNGVKEQLTIIEAEGSEDEDNNV